MNEAKEKKKKKIENFAWQPTQWMDGLLRNAHKRHAAGGCAQSLSCWWLHVSAAASGGQRVPVAASGRLWVPVGACGCQTQPEPSGHTPALLVGSLGTV